MRGVFKIICLAAAASLIMSFAAFADEPQNDSAAYDGADAAIGGGQSSDSGADTKSDIADEEQSAKSGDESSCSGGGSADCRYRAYSVEQAVEYFNVQDYIIEDSEKQNMHGYKTALRRNNAVGEAWIVFEIPYVSEIDAISLHLPEDVAQMKFEFSKDGKSWAAADADVKETPENGRWTKVNYSESGISGVRYVKAVWGEEENLQNWWNPYFIGITAKAEKPRDYEIVIDTGEYISVPMYDSRKYVLSARVLDQIGIERDSEILWSGISENSEPITVSSDGSFTISADMTAGTKFTVRAQCGKLSAEKTFTLCAALPGDIDGDNIITQADIDVILENYGKTVNSENRLCDVDKNGRIDIIDLCYAARYINIDFNEKSDDNNKSDSGDDKDGGNDAENNTTDTSAGNDNKGNTPNESGGSEDELRLGGNTENTNGSAEDTDGGNNQV